MTTTLKALSPSDFSRVLSGDETLKQIVIDYLYDIADLVDIIEGSGAPTFKAKKHSQYFDTATSRYYRNTDGGTTWVALN